jgi:hypothetical protein
MVAQVEEAAAPQALFASTAIKCFVTLLRRRSPSQAVSMENATATLQMFCNAASPKPHRTVENARKNKNGGSQKPDANR